MADTLLTLAADITGLAIALGAVSLSILGLILAVLVPVCILLYLVTGR